MSHEFESWAFTAVERGDFDRATVVANVDELSPALILDRGRVSPRIPLGSIHKFTHSGWEPFDGTDEEAAAIIGRARRAA